MISSCQIYIPPTMRLCNSRTPEECLMCYQTSQRNWVIINMIYRYLRRCLLGWHRSRLGFVTPSIGEVSLGPLGNTHHKKPCKTSTGRKQGVSEDHRPQRRYLRRCLLGQHSSRLGFVTPSIEEVSLGPLGNAHHYMPCKQCN